MTRFPVLVHLAAALAIAAGVSTARAQDTEVGVDMTASSRQTYVGEPIRLLITFRNTRDYDLPDIRIPGARVQLQPGSSQQQFSSGATSSFSFSHTYAVIPTRAGSITVPALSISAAGETYRTEPIEILVLDPGAQLPPPDELLLVDVESDRDTFYLGEPVEVTLRVWIYPYRDQQFNLTVSRSDMWNMIRVDQSEWGEFRNTLAALQGRAFPGFRDNVAVPEGGETLRADAKGVRRSFYLYEMPATIWPKQDGPLRLDDIRVIMDYPTRLQRTRDIFRSSLSVAAADALAARVESTPITIKATPEAGRPESFTGAVGRFAMTVQAQPTEVAVGDPITIAIDIRDRTTGGSRLDVLQPPRMQATPELVEHFRIPTDPLAGEVVGTTKRFVQTIRAITEDVTRIPPIEFAYFDPLRETYVTIESDPIPLIVTSSPSLTMGDIIEAPGGSPAAPSGPTQLTEVTGGVLANYTGADLLLRSQSFTFTWTHAGLLAAPPLLVGFIAVGRRRTERLRTDSAYARRRVAKRKAHRLLAEATAGADHQVQRVAAAVCGYVSDRCNLPAGVTTRTEVKNHLTSRGAPMALIDTAEELLAACEHAQYAGGTNDEAVALARRAEGFINELERVSL